MLGVKNMISNQILQNTIDGLKAITKTDITVMDADGKIVATTEDLKNDDYNKSVLDFVNSPAESMLIQGYQFFKIYDEQSVEYVISVKGEDEDVYKIGKITTFQIQNLLVAYKERFDKDNFIKNLLLDNLLLVDIYNRAKKLHIENNVKRVVYLIETSHERDTNVMDVIRSLFPTKVKDFITAVDEKNIILVKEVNEDSEDNIERIAKMILDTLNSEAMSRVYISLGTVVKDLKDVSKSYKEAKMALEVGKIFNADKYIIHYDKLGIGRLIYQLPLPLCKMFIEEIFHDKSIEEFDEETLNTINKFFENSLNVSETSRQLYIHRNTLVYRLDKLQKNTGLDLRKFEDAITFKIALMVAKYMKFMDTTMY